MAKSLENKVIIVTGASEGIGHEIAQQLGDEGAIVVLTARREAKLMITANDIRAKGGSALVVPADLRNYKDIHNVVKTTVDSYGRIDALINVAGMGYYDWIEEMTADEIREQLDVNVLGMAEFCREVVPIMKAQNSGHIINFASYASRISAPPMTFYAMTKYAIEGLTDGLRRELAPWNIKVTRVHPSAVDTMFNTKAAEHGGIFYPYDKLTGVTAEKVAKQVIKALKRPRTAVYVSRLRILSEIGVLVNRHLPGLIDFALKPRVKKMWRKHNEHDLAEDLVTFKQRRV